MTAEHEENKVIVVVDDEVALLGLFQVVLEGAGYHVLPFPYPPSETDLRTVGDRPDLFVLDMMLPVISGMELAEQLQAAGFGEIPKIGMSASRERVAQAEQSDLFHGTLRKPFDVDQLLQTVEHFTRAG